MAKITNSTLAETKIEKNIVLVAQKFSEAVKTKYNVENIILFGSYATGSYKKESDIDIAIVSNDWTDIYDAMAELMGLTWDIDTRIEPHPIKKSDFDSNEDFFIKEIKTTGIKIA